MGQNPLTSVEASYRRCRNLNLRYGSTYFWAANVLGRSKRRHVHALYAFCRYADDIVDVRDAPVDEREQALEDFGARFFRDLKTGHSDDPILAAVVDTVSVLAIDPECFQRFMRSMRMDLTKTAYADFDDLMDYMDGSAAVIGEMMLPVLRPLTPKALAPARSLGVAFQLTNFLRDVGEDLRRGRVYVPQDTLTKFGADPAARTVTAEWRAAMRYEVERTRGIYAEADAGLHMLPTRSARSIAAARKLYSGILDRIEANDYDVFSQRARVPYRHKVGAFARAGLPVA